MTVNCLMSVGAAMLTLGCAPIPRAGDAPSHRLGDHPAVVVQRLVQRAGYDYASKFYAHPAGLRLLAEPPRDPSQQLSTAGVAPQVMLAPAAPGP
jgi:hypothetical protein